MVGQAVVDVSGVTLGVIRERLLLCFPGGKLLHSNAQGTAAGLWKKAYIDYVMRFSGCFGYINII